MTRSFSSDPRPDGGEDPPKWNPIFIIIGTGIGGKPK